MNTKLNIVRGEVKMARNFRKQWSNEMSLKHALKKLLLKQLDVEGAPKMSEEELREKLEALGYPPHIVSDFLYYHRLWGNKSIDELRRVRDALRMVARDYERAGDNISMKATENAADKISRYLRMREELEQ